MLRTTSEKLDYLFDEIGWLMGCDEQCERECVFQEVGTTPHRCPINEFRDRVVEVIERRAQ